MARPAMGSRSAIAVNLVLAAVLAAAYVPFTEAGIPAVRFIEDGEHVEFQHNPLDTLDRIDPVFLRRVAQLALTLASTGWGDGPAPGE